MKTIALLLLATPLFLVASCGNSNTDIVGKWTFSDVAFPNGLPAKTSKDDVQQMREVFRGMTYDFSGKGGYVYASNLSETPIKGTYTISGKDLKMKSKGNDQHLLIEELDANKLVLELPAKNKNDRFQLVFTR